MNEKINLNHSIEIPGTGGMYLLLEELEGEKGTHKIYSKHSNRILKDCHARVPPREYNIKHEGVFKMLGIETIKKMCFENME